MLALLLNPRHHSGSMRGISLVEVLVVIAILGILSTLTVPAFVDWLNRSKMRNTFDGLHQGIQLARIEALSRNAKVRFILNTDLSWQVVCVGGETLTSGCPVASEALHKKSGRESKGGYTVTVNPVTGTTIEFMPSGRTNAVISNRITQIEFASNTANANSPFSKLRVDISNFGKVRSCAPYAPVGAPTAC